MAGSSQLIDRLSVFLSEVLGTAILVFLGCLGCLTWGKEYNHLQTVLSFGIVVMIAIQIFGCVSGAHINPAISVAAAVYNIIDVKVSVFAEFRDARDVMKIYLHLIPFFLCDRRCVCTYLLSSLELLWDTASFSCSLRKTL